jgi:hypothetical protein
MDEEEQANPDACCPVEIPQREACAVARRETTAIAVAVPEGDDPRKYPRYIFRPSGSQLRLFSPGMRNPARAPAFDVSHWQEYLDAYHRPMLTNVSDFDVLPETAQEGATLPARSQICEDITVPLCRLEGGGEQPTRLVFDPCSSFRWTTYQLKDALVNAQPNWRGLIERTLMFFPIEHLETSNARGIYFDFRAGNPHLGPRATVGDGGTNDGSRGILIISFAALNRWVRRGRYPASEAEIDAYYSLEAYASDPTRVVGTFYHELGHFLRLPGRVRIDREGDLRFRRFFCGLVGGGYGGHSLGYSEAFSEAYRYRLLGQSCPANPYTREIQAEQIRRWSAEAEAETHANTRRQLERLVARFRDTAPRTDGTTPGQEMDTALDEMGMPTAASVREARAAILLYLRSRGC